MLIHEGGVPTGDYNECPGISGPIVDIVKKLDRAVDLVVSGHTHQAYVCTIDGRLVTSGDKYGTIVTTIDVKLDPETRDVISASASNHIVRLDAYAKDAEQTALIAAYQQLAGPIANRKSGVITASLTREPNIGRRNPRSAMSLPTLSSPRPQRERRRRGDRHHQSRRHSHRFAQA